MVTPQRYLVIGASGSGKTTLARVIAERLGLAYTPTDPFFGEPGRKAASADRVAACLGTALAQPTWTPDGNFDDRCERVWAAADCCGRAMTLDLDGPDPVSDAFIRSHDEPGMEPG